MGISASHAVSPLDSSSFPSPLPCVTARGKKSNFEIRRGDQTSRKTDTFMVNENWKFSQRLCTGQMFDVHLTSSCPPERLFPLTWQSVCLSQANGNIPIFLELEFARCERTNAIKLKIIQQRYSRKGVWNVQQLPHSGHTFCRPNEKTLSAVRKRSG